jgi:hypothetical protein
LFAMNAAVSTEFLAMRYGGRVALIRLTMRSQRGDHGASVICNIIRPGGGAVSANNFPPLISPLKVWSLWVHDRWRTLRFGQDTQTALWDEPIVSHHVSRNFRFGCAFGLTGGGALSTIRGCSPPLASSYRQVYPMLCDLPSFY